MTWDIAETKTFSQEIKKFNKNKELLNALDNKIKRLNENPDNVGGYLSGKLHGYKSTRLVKKFRLIFKINQNENTVYLSAIDHRKYDYENFDVDSFE